MNEQPDIAADLQQVLNELVRIIETPLLQDTKTIQVELDKAAEAVRNATIQELGTVLASNGARNSQLSKLVQVAGCSSILGSDLPIQVLNRWISGSMFSLPSPIKGENIDSILDLIILQLTFGYLTSALQLIHYQKVFTSVNRAEIAVEAREDLNYDAKVSLIKRLLSEKLWSKDTLIFSQNGWLDENNIRLIHDGLTSNPVEGAINMILNSHAGSLKSRLHFSALSANINVHALRTLARGELQTIRELTNRFPNAKYLHCALLSSLISSLELLLIIDDCASAISVVRVIDREMRTRTPLEDRPAEQILLLQYYYLRGRLGDREPDLRLSLSSFKSLDHAIQRLKKRQFVSAEEFAVAFIGRWTINEFVQRRIWRYAPMRLFIHTRSVEPWFSNTRMLMLLLPDSKIVPNVVLTEIMESGFQIDDDVIDEDVRRVQGLLPLDGYPE